MRATRRMARSVEECLSPRLDHRWVEEYCWALPPMGPHDIR
jgi:hypothetical protein